MLLLLAVNNPLTVALLDTVMRSLNMTRALALSWAELSSVIGALNAVTALTIRF